MTLFAKVVDGVVQTYPYTLRQLQTDNPHTSFPAVKTDEALAAFNTVVVQETAKPAFDTATQTLVEGTPTKAGSVWQQVWTVQPLPAEEVARRVKSTQFEADRAYLKDNAWIAAVADWTPQQVEAWIDANVNNQVDAKALLKRLAPIVFWLVRQELR